MDNDLRGKDYLFVQQCPICHQSLIFEGNNEPNDGKSRSVVIKAIRLMERCKIAGKVKKGGGKNACAFCFLLHFMDDYTWGKYWEELI